MVTWRLDAGCEEDPELLVAASHRAADRREWKLTARLAEAALRAGKEDDAALVLADAFNHLGRPQEALDTLGDGRAPAMRRSPGSRCLRAYTLYWGLGRLEEAEGVLTRTESMIADVSEPHLAGRHPGRNAHLPRASDPSGGRPAATARPRPGLAPAAEISARTALSLALAWAGRPEEAVSIIEAGDELRGHSDDHARFSVRWSATARLSGYRMAGRMPEMETLAQAEYASALDLRQPGEARRRGRVTRLGGAGPGPAGDAINYFRESVAVLENVYWPVVRSRAWPG